MIVFGSLCPETRSFSDDGWDRKRNEAAATTILSSQLNGEALKEIQTHMAAGCRSRRERMRHNGRSRRRRVLYVQGKRGVCKVWRISWQSCTEAGIKGSAFLISPRFAKRASNERGWTPSFSSHFFKTRRNQERAIFKISGSERAFCSFTI